MDPTEGSASLIHHALSLVHKLGECQQCLEMISSNNSIRVRHDMAMRPPDIGQLRAALAVSEFGTVTRAAEQIGLTQPAVTRLVAALEAEIGFPLFDRQRRRLVPSEAGRNFLKQARGVIGELSRLGALGEVLRRGHPGLLRIAAVSALAHGLAPRLLAALLERHPGLSIEIEELDRAHQIEGLRAHHLDIGLVALPVGAPGLQVQPVAKSDVVCLLPEGHPLAARAWLDPASLAGERFVGLREVRLLGQMVDDAFAGSGYVREISVQVDGIPLMISCVAGGLGLAVIHRLSALALPQGVVARPFRPPIIFGYAALTRTSDHQVPLLRQVVQLARITATKALGKP